MKQIQMPSNFISRMKGAGFTIVDKLVYTAVILNNEATQAGIYETSLGDLAYLTELRQDEIAESLKKLQEHQLLVFDRGIMYVPQMCKCFNWVKFYQRMASCRKVMRAFEGSKSLAFAAWVADNPVEPEDLEEGASTTSSARTSGAGRQSSARKSAPPAETFEMPFDDASNDDEGVLPPDRSTNGHTHEAASTQNEGVGRGSQPLSTHHAHPADTPHIPTATPPDTIHMVSHTDNNGVPTTYGPHPIAVVKGKGKELSEEEERKYREGGAGGTTTSEPSAPTPFVEILP